MTPPNQREGSFSGCYLLPVRALQGAVGEGGLFSHSVFVIPRRSKSNSINTIIPVLGFANDIYNMGLHLPLCVEYGGGGGRGVCGGVFFFFFCERKKGKEASVTVGAPEKFPNYFLYSNDHDQV